MFVTVSDFRVRRGEEDAVVALHEDWVKHLRPRAPGLLSAELLVARETPSLFVRITRYEDEAAARATEADPEHGSWWRRLASLSAEEIRTRTFRIAWTVDGGLVPAGARADAADTHRLPVEDSA